MSRDIVLIVDDEPVLLRMCSIAVAQAGFRPVVAENGAAGLEAFMILKGDLCLLLSDIIMPAMNGLQLSETILRIAPGMKIPLMSGYSDEVIEVQGRNCHLRHKVAARESIMWPALRPNPFNLNSAVPSPKGSSEA